MSWAADLQLEHRRREIARPHRMVTLGRPERGECQTEDARRRPCRGHTPGPWARLCSSCLRRIQGRGR